MQYIENDGHVTREYDIIIDKDELQRIIQELLRNCYRIVNKNTKVAAYSKEEATKKINEAINSVGMKINCLLDISEGYKDLVGHFESLYVYDCNYLCKESPKLVYILEKILSNYLSMFDYKNENNRLIDLLKEYQNSDELKPYNDRLLEIREKIFTCLNNDVHKWKDLYQLHKESQKLLQESRYNKDFNFTLLNELYLEAKECIQMILISQTIHYKDLNDNPKVYQLGTRKKI